ncbi:MAG: hypothetical protein ACFUZC_03890 [Chthoniobacteraceae bacterium]
MSQWPDGPQADPESLKAQKEYDAALDHAAIELGTDNPLTEMPEIELRQTLKDMEQKLGDCHPESPMATVLEWRIDMAKALLDEE